MTELVHLTLEQVVDLNERHCADSAGVLDRGGVEAQLARARGGYFGADPYPTIWEKAAVLLHGLSTTQYFSNGNKRTAWLTASLFLAINGHPLRDVPDIQAEAFVLSIALKSFESSDERERGISKAAEWFESAAVTASDRLQWAEIATAAATPFNNGILDISHLGTTDFEIDDPASHPPGASGFYCVAITNWRLHPWDMGRIFEVTVRAQGANAFGVSPYSINRTEPYRMEAGRFVRADEDHPTPVRFIRDLWLDVHAFGEAWIVIYLDGVEAGRLRLDSTSRIEPPSDRDLQMLRG